MSADANLAVTTDVEGYLRPTGAGVVDIGADEEGVTVIPSSSGTFESATIDLGASGADFSTLTWNPGSQPVGTNLYFNVAANNDNTTWNYLPLSDEAYPAGVTVKVSDIKQGCTGTLSTDTCFGSLSAWEAAKQRDLVVANEIEIAKIDGAWTAGHHRGYHRRLDNGRDALHQNLHYTRGKAQRKVGYGEV